MPIRWVVLLEAAREPAYGPIDARDLERLHDATEPGPYGGFLHSPDRYALQVTATGASPLDALSDVVPRWADAVRRMELPAWNLVRTEVFTPEELEREFEEDQSATISFHRTAPDAEPEPHDDVGHELLQGAFSDPSPRSSAARPSSIGWRACSVAGALWPSCPLALSGAAADEVLISMARRLATMLRPRHVLARLGGEYGVLLEDCTAEAALAIAERMLQAVSLPMVLAGDDLTLSGSAGVAVGRAGESAQAVVANAGAALHAAKAAGGGRTVLYGREVSAQLRHVSTPPLPPCRTASPISS